MIYPLSATRSACILITSSKFLKCSIKPKEETTLYFSFTNYVTPGTTYTFDPKTGKSAVYEKPNELLLQEFISNPQLSESIKIDLKKKWQIS